MIDFIRRLVIRIRVWFLKRAIKRAMKITITSYLETMREAKAMLYELPALAKDTDDPT
jgi:hypothetical protein